MTRTFTDAEGDTWALSLTLGDFDAVQAYCGLDLLAADVETSKRLAAMATGADVRTLLQVIETLCGPEVEQRGLTSRDFQRRLVGETIAAARDAFFAAYADFFPQPRKGLIEQVYQDAQTETAKAAAATLSGQTSGALPPSSPTTGAS